MTGDYILFLLCLGGFIGSLPGVLMLMLYLAAKRERP